jgi:hypothetical protein
MTQIIVTIRGVPIGVWEQRKEGVVGQDDLAHICTTHTYEHAICDEYCVSFCGQSLSGADSDEPGARPDTMSEVCNVCIEMLKARDGDDVKFDLES